MKPLTLVLVCSLATMVSGQSTSPTPTRPATTKSRPATTKTGKPVIPDPDLLDGSKFEAEKRPLYGMLAEIEMGEKEGKGDKVSPDSGPGGAGSQSPEKSGSAGGPPPPAGGSPEKIAEGPEAAAEGIQVAKLEVPAGAAAADSGPKGSAARDLQIGDATLQIQTTKTASPDVVGTQTTNTQQYENKVPAGQQSDNRNKGVEKGQIIPQGL